MTSKRSGIMTTAGRKQETPVWGLSRDKWREIGAFCLLALALLLALSLVGYEFDRRWIGSVGERLAKAMRFVMGGWIAFVFPALLLLAAVHAFRRSLPFHAARKAVAGVLIVLSLCALLTLPFVVAGDETGAFDAGGAIGTFITWPGARSLNLTLRCGLLGTYLLCAFALVLGAMLSTGFLFAPLIQRSLGWPRALVPFLKWRRPAPVATLRFERDAGSRVFPVSFGDGRPSSASGVAESGDSSEGDGGAPGASRELPAEIDDEMLRPPRRKVKDRRAAMEMVQAEIDFSADDFELPPVDLLSSPPAVDHSTDRDEIVRVSGELEQALSDFNISARVVAVTQGPVVTRYELQPAPGVKVSRILSLENDIALILRAKSVRIQAPIPGKAAIGIEVPNRHVTPVYFKELIETPEFQSHPSPLAFVLGRNIEGEPVICDLATMPHLLIAGTTGSGKSVCINAIICSFLYRMPPDKVKFIMIDPKRVELNVYSEIPYLLAPVVNEPRQAAAALMWAVGQMEERLQLFSELRVRNIDGYNSLVSGKRRSRLSAQRDDLKRLPHIVIIIDELADLMLIARNEVEEFVIRLAQMSRAAGIHMIIATQRPSVNVITGVIKANFPSRIAFQVSAKVDSRTILDMNGAETLLGRGDMLYAPGGVKPVRTQGAFLSDHDVETLSDHLRAVTPAAYEKTGFAMPADVSEGSDFPDQSDRSDSTDSSSLSTRSTSSIPSTSSTHSPLSIPTELSRPRGQVEFPSIQLKGESDEDEELYTKALRMVLESHKPSVSMIQRRLKIGFARAGRLMDLMEERGIVGPYLGSKPRDLVITDPDALLRRLDEIEREGPA